MASGIPFSPSYFAPMTSIPDFPGLNLSDDELGMANWLAMRLFEQRSYFDLRWLYYDAEQKFRDLGISISPTLSRIRPALGWSRIGVDALVHRTVPEGFLFPGATDVDEDLMGMWKANKLDSEAPMTHLEAFVSGRAYNIVGPGNDSTDGQPLITSESPINMAVQYDAAQRRVTGAVQIYYDGNFSSDMYGSEVAAVYTPTATIHLARQAFNGNPTTVKWEVTARDDHGLGFAPIVRMANRSRLTDRDGSSEINAAWMNITDSACRTLLAMEISRELHAMPRRYVLGASESDFQNPDGTPVSKLKSYMEMIWLLERDEEGEVPTVGEFRGSDPSPYTKLNDLYKESMAVEMGLPVSMMGIHSQGNPASADAIRVGFEELTQRSRSKQASFGDSWCDTVRLGLLIRDGTISDAAKQMQMEWRDPAPQTPGATSDALMKQVEAGSVPATSDVVLKRLGYGPAERLRLAQDRDEDQGTSFLQEIAHNLAARAARTDNSLDVMAKATPVALPGTKQPVPTPETVPSGPNRNG